MTEFSLILKTALLEAWPNVKKKLMKSRKEKVKCRILT